MFRNTPLTITDLKKYLGPGLGLRKNKYLLEIPFPGIEAAQVNVLARSAGFPERTITAGEVFHKGRRYAVRGETDYGTTYEVSIVDDSNMSIRKKFDDWLKYIDDSAPKNNGLFGAASYEKGTGALLDIIKSGIGAGNKAKGIINNPVQNFGDILTGIIDPSTKAAQAKYQTDINIWQLDGQGNKVYGYKLQNAFPIQMGIVTLDDGDINTLSEFSIQFGFSEYIPLVGVGQQLLNSTLGNDVQNIVKGAAALLK